MFSRDRDKNVSGGGAEEGGYWSDSYISRMQGHPHHLGISWGWLQPPVNPSQGSFEIQGKSHGQEQGWPCSEGGKGDFSSLFGLSYHGSSNSRLYP